MSATKITRWLGVVLAALFGIDPGLADDCPASFRSRPPEAVVDGGVFFLDQAGDWAPLGQDTVRFSGQALQLIFVPRLNLCDRADGTPGKRDDCGDVGFLLVKTTKKTGAVSDNKVLLERGIAFARETGFKARSVDLEQYQAFHTDEILRASVSIREQWHARYKVAGVNHTTFQPIGKRRQFAFADNDDKAAWRVARLMRFTTPEPDQLICVPFFVAWNTPGMQLRLDVMLVDPVLDDFGFDPTTFNLKREIP